MRSENSSRREKQIISGIINMLNDIFSEIINCKARGIIMIIQSIYKGDWTHLSAILDNTDLSEKCIFSIYSNCSFFGILNSAA